MSIALAILAHPDDAEFLCAGALIRLRQERGYVIHIATMTPGDCGSEDLPPDEIAAIRRAEGRAAAAEIGADYTCLEERDLRVIYSDASVEKTVRLINRVRPTVVITHSPDDYHLDHEQTSKIVRAATFAAPIPNYLFRRNEHPPLDHIPHLYYCDPLEGKDVFGKPIPAGIKVDISKVMDLKSKALEAHHSQRAWLLKHHGVDNFVDSMKEWCQIQAKPLGIAYAEGFRQHRGHSYPQSDLLAETLGAQSHS
ncbi:MAG: PIG-L deacetylase family protein [Gemmataceae bacterium]